MVFKLASTYDRDMKLAGLLIYLAVSERVGCKLTALYLRRVSVPRV